MTRDKEIRLHKAKLKFTAVEKRIVNRLLLLILIML